MIVVIQTNITREMEIEDGIFSGWLMIILVQYNFTKQKKYRIYRLWWQSLLRAIVSVDVKFLSIL